MGLSIYYMGLSRFHIGDLVKELNLDKYGFVEKIEEHYVISEKNFVFVYYIRMFHAIKLFDLIYNVNIYRYC